MVRARALTWALAVGVLGGGGWGTALALVRGWNPVVTALVGFVVVGAGVYWIAVGMTLGAARTASTVYTPSGGSTPRRAEYSEAQALEARGDYGDAATAYEIAALESDGDAEPYLRLARLYRDRLRQPDDALAWFGRARTDADLTRGQELMVIQEIVDLYTKHLGTPRKAIPELVTVCQQFAGTPAARAATRELSEIREMLARERDGLASFTSQYLERHRRVT